jgi:hypothetical protein
MPISTTLALRWLGLSGILGSVLFVIGDLLYNHIPGSDDSPAQRMGNMSQSRVLNAGTLGLVGCWLYVLASAHLYIAFLPVGTTFAFVTFVTFAAVMVGFGIAHTAYFAIASGAQVAVQLGSPAQLGGKLGNTFFRRLVHITYAPVAVSSLMMLYGIVTGRSMYPRWMALFLPLVIYLLKKPIVRVLKGHLQEIVSDAYDNLVLFVYYVISTAVLWNGGAQ